MAAIKKKLHFQFQEKDVDENSMAFEDVYIFPSGDKYEGQILRTKNGGLERSGFGKQIAINGTIYEGQWLSDAMNGHGCLSHSSGDSYEGQFSHNQFHGIGTYTWANGAYLHGNFEHNRLEGKGVFTDTMNQIWEGHFSHKLATGLMFKLNMN